MASWNDNKVVGSVAGAVAVIALIILIGVTMRRNSTKISPETKIRMEEVTKKMQQIGE